MAVSCSQTRRQPRRGGGVAQPARPQHSRLCSAKWLTWHSLQQYQTMIPASLAKLASLAAGYTLACDGLADGTSSTLSKEAVDFGSLSAGHATSSPSSDLLEGYFQSACREQSFRRYTSSAWKRVNENTRSTVGQTFIAIMPAVHLAYVHAHPPVPLVLDKSVIENSIAKIQQAS